MNRMFDNSSAIKRSMVPAGEGSAGEHPREPRICMPSWRRFAQAAYHGGRYEAQDVISDSDDVDLICPDPGKRFGFKDIWVRRLIWRDVSQRLAYFVNPGLQKVRLTKEYDLLFVHCQTWWELLYINAIEGWKDHCKTSVCWIDEMWASGVPMFKNWIQSLKRFDHVILGMAGTVNAVSEAIERPCHYVPGAVDAIRFSPYPKPPTRVIDAYNMGRRLEGIHSSLLHLSQVNGMFYLYDTLQTGGSFMPDYRQHRYSLANLMKRSRFFMVAPAKINSPEERRGQVEIGFRYYEASAAGTVMIGQRPDCEPFRQMFGWPDSVIEIEPDGSDTAEVISALAKEPARLSEISRRNAAEALLRHDWVYRWKKILAIAGLEPTPALEARERRLRELAELALKFGGEPSLAGQPVR